MDGNPLASNKVIVTTLFQTRPGFFTCNNNNNSSNVFT